MKRKELQIIEDILNSCQEGKMQVKITSEANLDSSGFHYYINKLIKMGLINKMEGILKDIDLRAPNKNKTVISYKITHNGLCFLDILKKGH